MATTMTISLPEPMREFIESEVREGDYGSASELFREMVRERQKRKAQQKLEALLLEGLNDLENGNYIEITDDYWEKRRARLLAEVERRKKAE